MKKNLTRDQYNLYKLIYTRFVASQMKPAVFETVTVDHARRAEERREAQRGSALLRRAHDLRGLPRAVYRKRGRRGTEGRNRHAGAGGGRPGRRGKRGNQPALHPAAVALYRGVAGAHAGGKGHRAPEHLRADHHHHHLAAAMWRGKSAACTRPSSAGWSPA